MPTLEHNGLIEMFREKPSLAPHLLELLLHVKLPAYASVTVVEGALDQLVPVEFGADLVLELRDEQGTAVLVIILELQQEKDARKKRSWPVYVAAVHARKRCPTIILVVTQDAEVGAWAAEPIDLGLGLGIIRPLVIDPVILPEVSDPAEVVRVVKAKLWEWRGAQAWAALPPFAERFLDELRSRRVLEELGRLEAKREILLRLMTRAGFAVTEEDRAHIKACEDGAVLDRWVDNVIGAKSTADVLS